MAKRTSTNTGSTKTAETLSTETLTALIDLSKSVTSLTSANLTATEQSVGLSTGIASLTIGATGTAPQNGPISSSKWSGGGWTCWPEVTKRPDLTHKRTKGELRQLCG